MYIVQHGNQIEVYQGGVLLPRAEAISLVEQHLMVSDDEQGTVLLTGILNALEREEKKLS